MVWCANIRFAKIQMTKESFALESYVTLNHVAARFLHLMKLKMGCKFRSVSQKFISTFKAKHSVLIGGGIGITPLITMAYQLAHEGASFELHYCGASPEKCAFVDEIKMVC